MKKYSWMLLMVLACKSASVKPYWEKGCENLSWLSTMKQAGWKGEIWAYKYKGQVVFMEDSCVGCPDSMGILVDCTGKPLCYFGGFAGLNTCPDFGTTATDRALVWKN